jgi:type IV secretory pathway VirB2 component (pilin)
MIEHPNLRARVEARRAELEAALARLVAGDRARRPLEEALGQIDGLLTGNVDQIPAVVAAELSTWLESNKYLGVTQPP